MILKRRLVAAGILLAIALSATGIAGWLDYSRRAHRAEALRQEMLVIFRDTFPGQPVVVDVPLQMAAKIKEVEDRVRLIGSEGAQSALTVLQDLSSRIPAEIKVDVRDFSFGPEGVRVEGNAPSFDATNQMAKTLEQSPLVRQVQVADAKMSLDGSQVDFRMIISLSDQQVRP
jgi:general secretion pathway protein L